MKKIKPRLTFTVNFKVLMQIARRYKCLSALRTAERSLPCMDTHVKLQNVRLSNACTVGAVSIARGRQKYVP